MSEETKESIIIASILTAIIMIIAIIYGNTGSGFFRNLMIFIFGTIIGTPLAMIGRFVGKWFARIAFPQYETLYIYFGFIFGALIGGGLIANMFGNNIERGFISQCVEQRLSKSTCECIYDKVDDKYNVKDYLQGRYNKDDKFIKFYLNTTAKCIKENK